MENRRAHLEKLATGYSDSIRRFDSAVIIVYAALQGLLFFRLFTKIDSTRLAGILAITAIAALLGFIGADFVSGFLHWAADTWGTPEWPIVGQSLVRPFREHHLDQKAITQHGFVETNGATCLAALPFLLIAVFTSMNTDWGRFLVGFFTFQCFWGSPTGQFHKWAHQDSVPAWVQFLQRLGLILSGEKHRIHHRHPFMKNYCITSGVLNVFLDSMGFFGRLEALIHRWTGAIPREDDLATLRVGRLDENTR